MLQELGEKFKPMEVLALMKGELAKVPDLAKRCQEFLLYLIGTQNYKEFYKQAVAKINSEITIPNELIEHCDEFDPILCISDVVE